MKIKLYNKKLWVQYLSILGTLGIFFTLFSFFIDIKNENKKQYSICLLLILIIIFIANYLKENYRGKVKLKINGLNVNIFYGDLFLEEGLKIIPFNEYFDTIVDNKIIGKKSLNGQFILKNFSQTFDDLDRLIINKLDEDRKIGETNNSRHRGKQIKYKLGTTIEIDDEYALMALTKFDNKNRAYLSKIEYVLCLDNMWKELNIIYAQRNINIPLIGSGISRIGNDLKPQDYLYFILNSLKISNLDNDFKTSINIILYKDMKEDIDLFEIKSHF